MFHQTPHHLLFGMGYHHIHLSTRELCYHPRVQIRGSTANWDNIQLSVTSTMILMKFFCTTVFRRNHAVALEGVIVSVV
jgi:hypothetical protein